MKKITNILLSLACVLSFSSCEGFLDMAPTNQADSSTCLTSTHDAEVMLTGLIYNLTAASYYGRNFLLYGDAKGGDLTIYTGGNYLYFQDHTKTAPNQDNLTAQAYYQSYITIAGFIVGLSNQPDMSTGAIQYQDSIQTSLFE